MWDDSNMQYVTQKLLKNRPTLKGKATSLIKMETSYVSLHHLGLGHSMARRKLKKGKILTKKVKMFLIPQKVHKACFRKV